MSKAIQMERQLELIAVTIAEIEKRADQRHAEVMEMFEELEKTLEAICTPKQCD